MKKLFLIATILMSMGIVNAQDVVDEFNVGPYEVQYNGLGDVNYRLKKGVNLYDYFGLKKDTIINEPKSEPLKHGFQLSFFGETSMSRSNHSLVFGLEGVWKQKIAKNTYFNGGVSLGYAITTLSNINKDVIETGIPLSIEWTNINTTKAALYGAIKVTPTYFTTIPQKTVDIPDGETPKRFQGLNVSPGIDLGGYLPMGKQIVKIGVTFRYKIDCTTKDSEIYQGGLGRAFVGANIGIIF